MNNLDIWQYFIQSLYHLMLFGTYLHMGMGRRMFQILHQNLNLIFRFHRILRLTFLVMMVEGVGYIIIMGLLEGVLIYNSIMIFFIVGCNRVFFCHISSNFIVWLLRIWRQKSVFTFVCVICLKLIIYLMSLPFTSIIIS